ncbi:MAG: glycerol-3-phosphate 1-O-acyltransferase PlsY [Clostridia bacterium]|nr:glycerol-3-phosphate 1-O-acyltransferase PlsY [Clostridia bacterium]
MLNHILTLIIGYLLGSISSGVLLSRAFAHSDIRKQGSGNSGTTNMLRVMGRKMALITLACDMLKGIVAVFIGRWLVGGTQGEILGALGAILGHNFPVFFGFKGGKGIATSFGCLLIVFPPQTLAAFAVFLILFLVTHYVSVGSIGAAVTLPIFVLLTTEYDPIIWTAVVFVGLLAIARHSQNIVRLMHHTENKIDFSVFKEKKQ